MTEKKSKTKFLVTVAIAAATVECGKLVLAAVPNVEVVTLLLALYSYSLGTVGIAAAFIFCTLETFIWGFGTWTVSYFIYWPLVSLTFFLLGRMRVKNRFLLTGAALVLTLLFGVLSSLVDVGLFSGFFENFFERFAIYYASGIVFYVVQAVSNLVLFITVFPLLSGKLSSLYSSRGRRREE